jgi:ribonucleoside-diphosphate reductase alpha chain
MSEFADAIFKQKYAMEKANGELETWNETCERVVSNVLGALGYGPTTSEYQRLLKFIQDRKFIPGGRYLYASGRELHQVNNCFLVKAEDSREGWADLLKKAAMVLQTGGGLGVDYSDIREYGAPIHKTGGIASGPLPLAQMVNEIGRGVMQGGSRRSAIIALLDWRHPDCLDFIHMKDWPEEIRTMKEKDFNSFAPMDMTNISVNIDDEFFEAMRDEDHERHDLANEIYHEIVTNMISTGEPGFSVNTNGNEKEVLRNPCGEIVSADDSDVCNLGSLNFGRIQSIEELGEIVHLASLFLLAGTVYSDVPYDKIADIREKNRRLGLGIMGLHDWLLQRGYSYEPNEELGEWLNTYADAEYSAKFWAKEHGLSEPIATRAIAPAGSIGILGDTTTGIEPIFCVAYKRRYLSDGSTWKYQFVVDPTAHRLIEQNNIDPHDIEDAYTLSYNYEKRIWFQAWLQQFVDMGVSSTVNLPHPIVDEEEIEQFKETLLPHLPNLRGITCYPDGARGGQPLVPSTYEEAVKHRGVVFEDDVDNSCRNGVCGA